MRQELTDPALMKYAGRFVWLELNYDQPGNKDFVVGHAVRGTPMFFVLDPADERVTASRFGSMTLPELGAFLERGERGLERRSASPADSMLAHGDGQLGAGRAADAAVSYRAALHAAAPGWASRAHALAQLTHALQTAGDVQACAEIAAAEAPRMKRDGEFVRVALSGLQSANRGDSAAVWAPPARRALVPIAAEAAALPGVDHDTHFQLYDALVEEADGRNDHAAHARWEERWLHELDGIEPRSDDERTALDIARVEAASALGLPDRFVGALEASERNMPNNYVPSLRLAQILSMGKHYNQAIAACDRGLTKVDGPLGRTWLLLLKGQAQVGKGAMTQARGTLSEARKSAQAIGDPGIRDNYLRSISRSMSEAGA